MVLRLYYSSDNLNEEILTQPEADDVLLIAETESGTPESLSNDIPGISELPPPDPNENVVILAEEPALLTVMEENRIRNQLAAEQQDETPATDDVNSDSGRQQANETDEPQNDRESVTQEPVSQAEEELEPVEQSEPEPSATEIPSSSNAMPSLLRVDARCQYSVQLGEFSALQTAFQRADAIESSNLTDVILTYNTNEYSVRTSPTSSFTEVVSLRNELSSRINDKSVSVVHQCYNNTIQRRNQ